MARKRTSSLAVTLSGSLTPALVPPPGERVRAAPSQPPQVRLSPTLRRELEGAAQFCRDLTWALGVLGDLTRDALAEGLTLGQIAEVSGLPVDVHQDALASS